MWEGVAVATVTIAKAMLKIKIKDGTSVAKPFF